MGLFSKDIRNLDDLFVHQLRDIYYAEKQIVQSLPEMIEKATDSNLKRGFETHLGETKNHVKRLEQVFKMQASRQRELIARRSTGLSRKPMTSSQTSRTKKCSMPH